jgi:hypothetical protein
MVRVLKQPGLYTIFFFNTYQISVSHLLALLSILMASLSP